MKKNKIQEKLSFLWFIQHSKQI